MHETAGLDEPVKLANHPFAARPHPFTSFPSTQANQEYSMKSGCTLMKTLIVDDEPIARQVLREELEPYSDVTIVGEADNGKLALRKIEELEPDLVFLDLQMPVMGGFDVIRNLKGPHRRQL